MNKKKRFLLLLDKATKSAIRKTEKEFNTSITSSSELSSEFRAQNVYDTGNALLLKNLGIVVIESDDIEHVNQFCSSNKSPVVYFEESKPIFRPNIELDMIEQIKDTILGLNGQVAELEEYLRSIDQPQPNQAMTWGLDALNIGSTQLDGTGVDVCILDTGFYLDHPDFNNRQIVGKSFVPNESWEDDKNGHGTHCTGTAVGNISTENGVRYGVAPGANIAIGKVLSNRGSGSTDWIYDAIDNCIEKKYKVVSMSLGAPVGIGQSPSPMFEQIGQLALQKQCLIIAAAGNESNRPGVPRPVNMPANCESIMAIAALEESLKVASFSNAGINAGTGGRIDLSAPGVNVYSSYSPNAPGNKLHVRLRGTSMATPHVAGMAALYWQAFPNLSASDIWRKLEKNAKQLNNQLIRDVGNGLVQVL